ncbi:NaCP60E [Symbiodinium natans]|uniref:NaCP60E protein n=1 Tax=Symbiodinium natans TaxID=878477 RepID=A0A812H5B5_9DINO|nr:NaCP60E [Symbiodinium natans]
MPPAALPPTMPSMPSVKPEAEPETDAKPAESAAASHLDLEACPAVGGAGAAVAAVDKEPIADSPSRGSSPGEKGAADVAADKEPVTDVAAPEEKGPCTLGSHTKQAEAGLHSSDLSSDPNDAGLSASGDCTDLPLKLNDHDEPSKHNKPEELHSELVSEDEHPQALPGVPDGNVTTPQLQSMDSDGVGLTSRFKSNSSNLRRSNFIAHENRRKVFEKQSKIQRLTESPCFESTSGVLILLNCLFVAWQTQSKALDDEFRAAAGLELVVSEPLEFTILQGIFVVCFSVELCLRFLADRWYLFNCHNPNAFWNWLDLLVVAFDLVSIFLEVWVQFSLLRVIRVVRVIRVAKMIRVMRTFQELRLLMHSIISCIRSLIWVVAVLCLMLGMFSVMFTSAVGSTLDNATARRSPDNSVLIEHFGTLDRSILNLYMAMTGGTDWSVQYEAMSPLPGIYLSLFLLYITFSIYALANVVTGIFLENARNSGKRDREHVIAEELQLKTQFLHELQRVFDEMDANESGTISKDEFQTTLQDERVQAYFNAMKLDAREVEYLFALLDYDGSGEVSYSEFVDGCWKLQGEARSLDMKILQLEIESLSKLVHHVLTKVSTDSVPIKAWHVTSTAFKTAEHAFSRSSRFQAPKEQDGKQSGNDRPSISG